MTHSQKNAGGFTLVELAIVLMIIGLLIGGILRGQELMNNTRMQNIIKQITSYSGAVNTFMDTYSAKPGDLTTATSRIPGCETGNTNGCQNGDGNGIIGEPVVVWTGGQQAVTTENTQFWKQLALTHIISGVNPSATVPEWGQTHPAAAVPGGFSVVTSLGSGAASVYTGALILRLHGSLTNPNIETIPLLSSKQSAYIDRKMDDGVPQTGDAQARAYGNGQEVADCEVAYDESREDMHCIMTFLMNR